MLVPDDSFLLEKGRSLFERHSFLDDNDFRRRCLRRRDTKRPDDEGDARDHDTEEGELNSENGSHPFGHECNRGTPEE